MIVRHQNPVHNPVMNSSLLAVALASLSLDERSFVDGLARNPGDVGLRASYGRWLRQKQRHLEAEVETRTAVFERPSDPSLRCDLAEVLADTGDPRARAEFEAAVRTAPNNSEVRRAYAAFLVASESYQEAFDQYEAAAQVGDAESRATALMEHAGVVETNGDRAAADKLFARAVAVHPSVSVLARYAQFSHSALDYRKAEELYEAALKLDEHNVAVLIGLAQLRQVVRRDPTGAEKLLRRAVEVPNGPGLQAYARFLRDQRDFTRMAEVARAAVAVDSTFAAEWAFLEKWEPLPTSLGECLAVATLWNAIDALACSILLGATYLRA